MEKNTITIKTPFIKLDSFLKYCGLAETGGHAKEIIADGIVYVNKKQCLMRGKKLYDGDVVEVDRYILTVAVEK